MRRAVGACQRERGVVEMADRSCWGRGTGEQSSRDMGIGEGGEDMERVRRIFEDMGMDKGNFEDMRTGEGSCGEVGDG